MGKIVIVAASYIDLAMNIQFKSMRVLTTHLVLMVIHFLANTNDFSLVHTASSSPAMEPEMEPTLDDIDKLTIHAQPVTVRSMSDTEYNIATQLANTTLSFGMTTAGDLWVNNAGFLKLFEPISKIDDPSSLGLALEGDTYDSPLECDSGFVVQEDDTLIFLSQTQY